MLAASIESCSCHEATTSLPPDLGVPPPVVVGVLLQASDRVKAAVATASALSPRSLARDRFIRVLPLLMCLSPADDSGPAGFPLSPSSRLPGARVRRRQ